MVAPHSQNDTPRPKSTFQVSLCVYSAKGRTAKGLNTHRDGDTAGKHVFLHIWVNILASPLVLLNCAKWPSEHRGRNGAQRAVRKT